jgi:putative endonuclease
MFLRNLFSRLPFDNNLDKKPDLGLLGEEAASRFLKSKKFKILVSRYRCKYGEIDLVARDKDTLVFIEVKTRTSTDHGDPYEAVTIEKQKHMTKVALDYLRKIKNPEVPIRFDIVEVIMQLDKNPECSHFCDTFPLSEPYIY